VAVSWERSGGGGRAMNSLRSCHWEALNAGAGGSSTSPYAMRAVACGSPAGRATVLCRFDRGISSGWSLNKKLRRLGLTEHAIF
jgi:hypothetical protein